MQALAQGGLDDAAVRALLHGPRTVAFRHELLDVDGTSLGDLSTVQGCTVEHGALDDVPRTAKLSLGADAAQVNYSRHRVRPWYRLRTPAGGWLEWPLGVFLLSTPVRTARPGASSREVECYDLSAALEQDRIAERLTLAAGANVVTTAVEQLAASGITAVSAEPSATTLPTALEYPPGTSRRAILSELLQTVNYSRLWFDGYGRAVLRPYRPPTRQAPDYRYSQAPAESVVAPGASDTLDLYAVPNRWIATVSEPDREPLTSVYTNTNPASPTSTVARGRVVATLLDGGNAASQEVLDAYVQRVALEASQVYRRVTFDTATMPHHEHLDLLDLDVPALGLVGLFTEVGWTLEAVPGGIMRHTVRQLVGV